MKKILLILAIILSATIIKAVDVKDYRPTKFRFTGDIDKAKTIMGDGNRLLFRLKNIQQAGAPDVKHLENKYSNGVVVTADTTDFGIDIVNIYWPQFGRSEEKVVRYIAPVFACYSFYNGDDSGKWDYETKPELFVVMKDFKTIQFIYEPSALDSPSVEFTAERYDSYTRKYGGVYTPDQYEYGTPSKQMGSKITIRELYEVDDWFSDSDCYSYVQGSDVKYTYYPEDLYYPDSCTKTTDTAISKSLLAFGSVVTSGVLNQHMVSQIYRYIAGGEFSFAWSMTESGMFPFIESFGFGDNVFKLNDKNLFSSQDECYWYSYRTETHGNGENTFDGTTLTDTRRVISDDRLRVKLKDFTVDTSVFLCDRYSSDNSVTPEYSYIVIPWAGIYNWNGIPVLLFCYRTHCLDKFHQAIPGKNSEKVGYIMSYNGKVFKSPIEYDALSSIMSPHELYDINGKTIDYKGVHYYASNLLRLVEVTETYKE